jgi:hypothetical protein
LVYASPESKEAHSRALACSDDVLDARFEIEAADVRVRATETRVRLPIEVGALAKLSPPGDTGLLSSHDSFDVRAARARSNGIPES